MNPTYCNEEMNYRVFGTFRVRFLIPSPLYTRAGVYIKTVLAVFSYPDLGTSLGTG